MGADFKMGAADAVGMASCEMCGKDVPSTRRALIEGTTMNVCGGCIKFGVEQAGAQNEVTGRSRVTASLERRATRSRTRDIYDSMQEELVPDYAERVREARVRAGMSVEDLGKKLMERQTTLAKVESGTFHPSDSLIQKLEKELNIKLKEKPEAPSSVGGQKPAGGPVTLGDLIKKQLGK